MFTLVVYVKYLNSYLIINKKKKKKKKRKRKKKNKTKITRYRERKKEVGCIKDLTAEGRDMDMKPS